MVGHTAPPAEEKGGWGAVEHVELRITRVDRDGHVEERVHHFVGELLATHIWGTVRHDLYATKGDSYLIYNQDNPPQGERKRWAASYTAAQVGHLYPELGEVIGITSPHPIQLGQVTTHRTG